MIETRQKSKKMTNHFYDAHYRLIAFILVGSKLILPFAFHVIPSDPYKGIEELLKISDDYPENCD